MPEPRSRPAAEQRWVRRFTRGERWVHRSLAALLIVLLVTAAFLYFAPLAQLLGRRPLFRQIHLLAGYALPLPLLLGWLRSAAFRRDSRVLNRFEPGDAEWLRSRDRRSGRLAVGKFNAGQKLNAAFTLGTVLVMLGTGLVMHLAGAFPLTWRTGATFVHDWLAFFVAVVVIGHVYMAAQDPYARLGMRTGDVPLHWARREHAAWAEQQTPLEDR